MIDGGPSVLFDAVALLTSAAAIDDLINEAVARDFVADAFQHCKFIGYDQSALPLLQRPGSQMRWTTEFFPCRERKAYQRLSPNSASSAFGVASPPSSSARHRCSRNERRWARHGCRAR